MGRGVQVQQQQCGNSDEKMGLANWTHFTVEFFDED